MLKNNTVVNIYQYYDSGGTEIYKPKLTQHQNILNNFTPKIKWMVNNN